MEIQKPSNSVMSENSRTFFFVLLSDFQGVVCCWGRGEEASAISCKDIQATKSRTTFSGDTYWTGGDERIF